MRPSIVMEATGHYHSPIIQFLDEHQYLYIVINPLISHNAKKNNLRRLKMVAADALLLGTLFYKEEFEPFKKRGQHLMNLRYLTRQHESLTGMYVQVKLQFHAILDQVFPEYHGVFGDLYSKVSLRFLDLHPTSKAILDMAEKEITATIQRFPGRGKSGLWCLERTQALVAAAMRNPFKETAYPSHLISMQLLIQLLLQYQDQIGRGPG
ncbi:IS110 family transposase [Paenibacillus lignilyticus]|uniref:IS110 family transposase n=1 Tax=Paenibacillus lignilyticus TaxID=1172615 RepID=UPI001F0A5739|nr:IS110 family transposase [Paenibacillus lignilyticus]